MPSPPAGERARASRGRAPFQKPRCRSRRRNARSLSQRAPAIAGPGPCTSEMNLPGAEMRLPSRSGGARHRRHGFPLSRQLRGPPARSRDRAAGSPEAANPAARRGGGSARWCRSDAAASARVRLGGRGILAAKELPRTRSGTAHRCGFRRGYHGDGIRRRTVAQPDVLAVRFHQAEEKRRMRRMVRHPDKIRLREVVDAGAGNPVERLHECSSLPLSAATNR